MKIMSVVGARPNFMKIAPFVRAVEKHNALHPGAVEHLLVHTGQHYDDRMSRVFFESLNIPEADIHLGIGSGTHAEQVGNTMIAFEKTLQAHRPDWVVVVGDVNATLACSVTAKKEGIRVCHIEAGLRSGDMGMPEEINRLVTDRLSDLLLTPDPISGDNLRREGVAESKIRFVGNVMIDTLESQRSRAAALDTAQIVRDNLLVSGQTLPGRIEPFTVVTMHRPSNVDDTAVLAPIVAFLLEEAAAETTLLWPLHPRTRQRLETFGLWEKLLVHPNVVLLHPLDYHAMLRLNMGAKMLFTDSGGLQEECCVLGTPCLTLRANTERPITLREHGGASVLVGNDVGQIREAFRQTKTLMRRPSRPELWDGHAAERALRAILHHIG